MPYQYIITPIIPPMYRRGLQRLTRPALVARKPFVPARLNLRPNLRRFSTEQSQPPTEKLFVAISEATQYGIALKHFPNIVVIGPQSAGKTSVVEAICGRNFMPKHMGMATKKKINLTIIRSPTLKFKIQDKEITDEKLAAEVIDRLNQNPQIPMVHVEIHAPDVYNSVITDVPGLFYVSKNDKELPTKIREITEECLADKANIILPVASATEDPATNQAIQMIDEYERDKDCIGAITKVDIASAQNATTIKEMLENKNPDFSLGYGWVALMLKTKKENDSGMTVAEKMVEEQKFFVQNPQYSPSSVETLRSKISQIQFERIRANVPELLKEIQVKIKDLESSNTFLEKLMDDPRKGLVSSLKSMIEKLVGSSLERAEFENLLKQRFREQIVSYIDSTIESSKTYVPEFSESNIDPMIFGYHHGNRTNPTHFKEDTFKELFSYGLVSPMLVNADSISAAFKHESALACAIPMFDLQLYDPMGKMRMKWNKQLRAYFSSLLTDNTIQDAIFNITQKELIDYITSEPENADELTKKFAEYIIREIGNEAYESKIKFSITAMINIEKRPKVNLLELGRHLTQLYQDYFTYHGGILESWRKNHKRIKVPVYSEPFNKAYLRVVSDTLSDNIYRNVSVNLLDNMVQKLLEMTIDMFNKDNVSKEKTKVAAKIQKLREISGIISTFSPPEKVVEKVDQKKQ
jgi:signal recognition particle receptor subunit beta